MAWWPWCCCEKPYLLYLHGNQHLMEVDGRDGTVIRAEGASAPYSQLRLLSGRASPWSSLSPIGLWDTGTNTQVREFDRELLTTYAQPSYIGPVQSNLTTHESPGQRRTEIAPNGKFYTSWIDDFSGGNARLRVVEESGASAVTIVNETLIDADSWGRASRTFFGPDGHPCVLHWWGNLTGAAGVQFIGVRKFDRSTGAQIWASPVKPVDSSTATTTYRARLGHIQATCPDGRYFFRHTDATANAFRVTAYDTDGDEVWTRLEDMTAFGGQAHPVGGFADGSVLLSYALTTPTRVQFAKWGPDGSTVWTSRTIGGATLGNSANSITNGVVDPRGNAYLWYRLLSGGGTHLLKFDRDGNEIYDRDITAQLIAMSLIAPSTDGTPFAIDTIDGMYF